MMNYISSDDGISNQNILLFLVSIMIIFTFAGNKYIVKIHSIPMHDNIGSSHSLFLLPSCWILEITNSSSNRWWLYCRFDSG